MLCRNCKSKLEYLILDLGTSPPANALLKEEELAKPELWYPLRLFVCHVCFLVQTEDFVGRETLFNPEYVYFSSYSDTWLRHAKAYVEMAVRRFSLSERSLVVEVASNDGYLLQYFKELGIPCYGIEPTHLTAEAARRKGIETIEEFFGLELAQRLVRERGQADLIVANNVLAHVPDIHDFVSGFRELLKPDGVATFEFQYVVPLVREGLFDTVYHEHFSYLSFSVACDVFMRNGLRVFDVELLPTHGGSLRVYVQRDDSMRFEVSKRVSELLEREEIEGVRRLEFYGSLQEKAERVKNEFLKFLLSARSQGKRVAGYGAAAKGNTLLNFAGVRRDLIQFVTDRNPAKQGKFLPGSRIPVTGIDELIHFQPDYVIILPWNLKGEIIDMLSRYGLKNCRFVTAIPELSIDY